MKLAIFDFDGTMTEKDSFVEFIVFAVGRTRFLLGLTVLFPPLIAYKLGWLSNAKAKEAVLRYYFRGWERQRFDKMADDFAISQIDSLLRPEAREKILWHKSQGHHVAVVTASPENYLKLWCSQNSFDLIATRLEIDDERLTGKIRGLNCHGQEKLERIKEKYTLEDFSDIYVYGDSPGDLALKEIATHFFYQAFSKK